MGDRRFAKAFRDAARPGIYFRVIRAGSISAHDPITFVSKAGTTVSILELFHAYYDANPTRARLEELLAAPIATRMRKRLQRQLGA